MEDIEIKKKRLAKDVVLSIIGSILPIAVLQLIILPGLSRQVSSDIYGVIVTALAMLNLFPATIGNALNNVRLLRDSEYEGRKKDFQILLIITEVINVCILFFLSCFYLGIHSIYEIVLLLICGVLFLEREYHIVYYRIRLDYVANVINNICLVFGFLVGYYIFTITEYWQLIYIIGYLFSFIHLLISSEIWKEPVLTSSNIKKVSIDVLFLVIASFLNRAMTLSDKILLYPLLGGTMVSVYHVATVFGKIVSIGITPINSVALSYLARIRSKSDSLFRITYSIGAVLCGIGYFTVIALSRPILTFLYPQYVDDAIKYVYITTASTSIYVLTSIIMPFVLRYFDMKWQIMINGITFVVYVGLSLVFLYIWGMIGFCIGSLISNVIKLITTTIIYYFGTPRHSNE